MAPNLRVYIQRMWKLIVKLLTRLPRNLFPLLHLLHSSSMPSLVIPVTAQVPEPPPSAVGPFLPKHQHLLSFKGHSRPAGKEKEKAAAPLGTPLKKSSSTTSIKGESSTASAKPAKSNSLTHVATDNSTARPVAAIVPRTKPDIKQEPSTLEFDLDISSSGELSSTDAEDPLVINPGRHSD